jgi:hypothetical protein
MFARFVRRSTAVLGTAGLAIAALAAPASAQFAGSARVHVPFAFTAGKVELPAGNYLVRRTDSNFLIVQNEDTHDAATLATAPLDIHHTSAKIALVFQRTERGTSLAEARWLDGTMTYRALGKASDARLAVVTAK